MQIEDYFEFLSEDDIRLKGMRIGIETVLHEHIYRGQTPEEIAQAYNGLTQEQAQDNNLTLLVQRLLKVKSEQ